MPKMKTHSGAKKRFRVTAKNRVKAKAAKSRHMMMNKPKSMKRKTRGIEMLFKTDGDNILSYFLPNSFRMKKKNRGTAYKSKAAKAAEGGK